MSGQPCHCVWAVILVFPLTPGAIGQSPPAPRGTPLRVLAPIDGSAGLLVGRPTSTSNLKKTLNVNVVPASYPTFPSVAQSPRPVMAFGNSDGDKGM